VLSDEILARMPKAEVHLHLEGTTSPETLWAMAERHGVSLPATTLDGLRGLYRFESFDKFIDLWLAMCSCLKSPEDYEQMVDGFVAECRRQNVRYVEAHSATSRRTSRPTTTSASGSEASVRWRS